MCHSILWQWHCTDINVNQILIFKNKLLDNYQPNIRFQLFEFHYCVGINADKITTTNPKLTILRPLINQTIPSANCRSWWYGTILAQSRQPRVGYFYWASVTVCIGQVLGRRRRPLSTVWIYRPSAETWPSIGPKPSRLSLLR